LPVLGLILLKGFPNVVSLKDTACKGLLSTFVVVFTACPPGIIAGSKAWVFPSDKSYIGRTIFTNVLFLILFHIGSNYAEITSK